MKYILLLCLVEISILASAQQLTDYFTLEELNTANTAEGESYLSTEEKDIYLFSNLARLYPRKFIGFYHDYVRGRKPTWKQLLERDHYYKTLTSDLEKLQPLEALYPDRELFDLAKCWAVESGQKGVTGHDRIECADVGRENCSYGYSKGIDVVMQLLIDKGVKSLGHRKNLLSNSVGMGASIQPHKVYAHCAVLDFWDTNDRLKKVKAERMKEFPKIMAQWTDQEMARVDQARQLNYLNEMEKDYYMYVNMMRLYPRKFKELFLDNGPYFNIALNEQTSIRSGSGFTDAANRLMRSQPGQPLIPPREVVEQGRCIAREMNRRNKFSLENLNCSRGQLGVSSYLPSDIYEYIITEMIDEGLKEFTGLTMYLILNEGEKFDVSVSLYR